MPHAGGVGELDAGEGADPVPEPAHLVVQVDVVHDERALEALARQPADEVLLEGVRVGLVERVQENDLRLGHLAERHRVRHQVRLDELELRVELASEEALDGGARDLELVQHLLEPLVVREVVGGDLGRAGARHCECGGAVERADVRDRVVLAQLLSQVVEEPVVFRACRLVRILLVLLPGEVPEDAQDVGVGRRDAGLVQHERLLGRDRAEAGGQRQQREAGQAAHHRW
mmetsp:Transcript_12838/g.29125  ORF Transcript_12838/g.29125 Transcript_12838/m.29125 type:complete len:230 (+) Transcript_12838:181-870(+)